MQHASDHLHIYVGPHDQWWVVKAADRVWSMGLCLLLSMGRALVQFLEEESTQRN